MDMGSWQRQLLILGIALLMSFYFTAKQGLWSDMMGTSPEKTAWSNAKRALQKQCGFRFELFEGANQRDDKRVLVLAKRPVPENEGDPAVPQTILAELFQVPDMRKQRKGRKRPLTREERQREDLEKIKKKKKKNRKGIEDQETGGYLLIYDEEALGFLRDAFHDRKGKKLSHSAVEITNFSHVAEMQRLAVEQPGPKGSVPTRPLPNIGEGGKTAIFESASGSRKGGGGGGGGGGDMSDKAAERWRKMTSKGKSSHEL